MKKIKIDKVIKNVDYGTLVILAKRIYHAAGKFIVWHNGALWCARAVLAEPLTILESMEYFTFCNASKRWKGGSYGY